MARPTPDPHPAGSAPRLATALPAPWRWLLAPLHALERTRGWRRLLLLGLELLVLAALLGLAWWSTSLVRLPDIGDPFDVTTLAREAAVPPERNAMPLYERALEALRTSEQGGARVGDLRFWDQTAWLAVDPKVQRWVTEHHAVLPLWLAAAERPDAALDDPLTRTALSAATGNALLMQLQDLTRLAVLEASRRRQVDHDPAGAWTLYRGVLRTSRHAGRNQGLMGRMFGLNLLQHVAGPIQSWAFEPGVDPPLLRRALADVRAAQALTEPAAHTVQHEYLMQRNTLRREATERLLPRPLLVAGLDVPPGLVRAYLTLYREPERALRISQLYFARWLAECGKPTAARLGYDRPASMPIPEIIRVGPEAPESVRAVDEPTLRSWIESSPWLNGRLPVVTQLPYISMSQALIDRDQQILDVLTIRLAEALYQLEHGEPAPSLGALIGPDLPRLPGSYEGTDAPESVVLPSTGRRR